MCKIILKGFIYVPVGELDAVRSALPVHIELTRKEPGCVAFDVELVLNSKNKFRVYEEFDSKASFELHQQRVKHSEWGRITKNVKRAYLIESE
ncbi:putative quinol monooxygenase [Saccharophagus degradans]|uniref:Antibiotic biosynthesis monooxygenase n=1 Tax=Saccharophagus degradans (strain 2-40 / ATCC 43961 / DSM 17024) TaxID=203122 RepID=Q21K73_SACD2|nr:antibiotic biosynthesis monooxygenase [Saccharophagus degradans]ABD80906.1 Antibiotic biosynthesis monooxygenase [Saccharophagus degradans 2-40]